MAEKEKNTLIEKKVMISSISHLLVENKRL